MPHKASISSAQSYATLFSQLSLSKHKFKNKISKNFKTVITKHKTKNEVVLTIRSCVTAQIICPWSHLCFQSFQITSWSSQCKNVRKLGALLFSWKTLLPEKFISPQSYNIHLSVSDAHYLYLQPLLSFWIPEPHIKLSTWHLYLDVSKEPQTWIG